MFRTPGGARRGQGSEEDMGNTNDRRKDGCGKANLPQQKSLWYYERKRLFQRES